MQPEQPTNPPVQQNSVVQNDSRIVNPLTANRAGEVQIFTVRRHPIGLLGAYGSSIMLVLLIAIGTIVTPDLLTSVSATKIHTIGLIAFVIAAVLAVFFVYIARIVYYGNNWILTDDSLTQVSRNSLFDRQSSQLSLGNLEDVTAEQDGILPHMFNYGVLRVETAGERSKFVFPYCPNPNAYAQKILTAREDFEQGRRYADQQGRLYNEPVAPPPQA